MKRDMPGRDRCRAAICRLSCRGPRLARPVLASLAALALAGCVVAPDVPEPKPITPTHYRDADSNRNDTAIEKTAWPAPGWWQNFGSPELDRLVAEARSANYDIAAAAARVAQANAQVRVSGAPLFPSLDAQGTASRNYQAGSSQQSSISLPDGSGGTTTTSIGSSGSTARNDYQATLNASYELDFWGENRSALNSAQQTALASRFDQATVALGVESSVASTYFTIVTLTERLRIARQNLDTARELLKAFNALLEVGLGTALDVAQQQTQVANQLAAIPPIRQELQQNINALAVLLGKPPAALDLAVTRPAQLNVPSIAAGLPATLLARRPDIAEARAQLAAARADVSAARAALLPSFDLTAQGGWENLTLGGLFDPVNQFYSLAANITQPIFEGGRLRGQVDINRGRYEELLSNYQGDLLNAFEDVDNALNDVRQTSAREQRQQQAVRLAQRALDIARARLREGITDVTTVLDTEQTLFSARDALAQDRLARLNAAVSLYQALGGGWDERSVRLSNATDSP